MRLPNVIAIDGPAGSGKSTISYKLAERYGYLFIDTGVYYRTVTLLALRSQTSFEDRTRLVEIIRDTRIDIMAQHDNAAQPYRVYIDDQDVTEAIRSKDVEKHVSTVSAIAEVRQALVVKQREAANKGKVIMAGRDIGTVVLPNADIKLYVDASLAERAGRRQRQLAEVGQATDLEHIQEALRKRDQIDSEREVSPLRQAEDAIYINTDHKTIEDVVEEIAAQVAHWGASSL